MHKNPAEDGKRYYKAMMSGNTHAALQIEKDYGLDGYPPEIVSHVLQVASNIAISEQDRCARVAYDWAHRNWGTPGWTLTELREALKR